MFLVLLAFATIAAYLYFTRNYDYWLKRNVKHEPPIPFFGNNFLQLFGFISITSLSVKLYNMFPDEKVVGYYRMSTPELIVRDLAIVRRIINLDFAYFYPRGLGRNPDVEPLHANLFHVDGDRWKLLRQRLTSAFTTAKLKAMFPLIIDCAEKLQGLGEQIVAKGGEDDVREMMARFTTDFIGACGFGIAMNSISNENSLFRRLGQIMFGRPLRRIILLAIWDAFPITRKFLYVASYEVENTIVNIVKSIREQRNFKPSGRNDFIDLLLEMEAKGKIKGDSVEKRNPDGSPVQVEMELDLKCMAAQVFVFFAAGFETSSSATSFTLHQLAYHPDKQKKLQEEIDRVLLKYNNKLCYDAIAEMSYLDMAFKEGMRIFPSLGVLHRVCARPYTIPELNITLDPGVRIVIPVQAIQNDEKYYEKPNEFIPERFSADAVEARHHYAYLPFGDGPRACIGARLGHMQSLAGLAAVLQKFNVEPAACSKRELVPHPRINVVQAVKGGVPLKLTLRKNKTLQ